MAKELIQMSYLIIVADITLFLFIYFNSTLNYVRKSAFLIANVIASIMIVCNFVTYAFAGTGKHIWLIKLFTALSYSVSGPVIIPFIFLSGVISKRVRVIIQAAAALNVVLSIVSIFNSCVFRIDNNGDTSLGPLAPIPFMLSAMYVAVLFASSVIKFRLGLRRESAFIMFLTIDIAGAVMLNTVYHYKFLISGMAVLSSIFYYMFFAMQMLTRDALTNALNRHSFYKDIQDMKKRQMFVISMDLNGLKQINDNLGHDEGDKAILAVADAAFAQLPPKCKFYRIGGDEFAILYPGANEEEVRELKAYIKHDVSERNYSVAMGSSEYRKGMDFDAVMKKADAEMYDDKARMKSVDAVMNTHEAFINKEKVH